MAGVTVDGYMTILREEAAGIDFIEKFYLGMFDNPLYEMEATLDAEGKNGELYEAITAEYRRWLAELTDEQRQRLAKHNRDQNSANKNWLLEELLEEGKEGDVTNASGT